MDYFLSFPAVGVGLAANYVGWKLLIPTQKSDLLKCTQTLSDTQLESIAKWFSCNGEVWGVGPTVVFASAASFFLYQELIATIIVDGDQPHVSILEKMLLTTMLLGMLALMIHLWVCFTRFFLYYLDTLIRDSPNMLLEITTASFLGAQSEMLAIGPLTKFLKQQQPQIHITVCWFLSLCYADYIRKNYSQRFNMPYLEQWQAELQARASRGVTRAMQKVNSFVGAIHQRLRGYTDAVPAVSEEHTESATPRIDVSRNASKIMWGRGCRRGSDSALAGRDKELCVRLVSQSSKTTADAIAKLRPYVTATKCTCCSSDPGVAVTGQCDSKPDSCGPNAGTSGWPDVKILKSSTMKESKQPKITSDHS